GPAAMGHLEGRSLGQGPDESRAEEQCYRIRTRTAGLCSCPGLGNRDEDLPVKERCAETLAAEGGTTSEAIQDRAELEAAMATLENAIWNTFLDSGQRRK